MWLPCWFCGHVEPVIECFVCVSPMSYCIFCFLLPFVKVTVCTQLNVFSNVWNHFHTYTHTHRHTVRLYCEEELVNLVTCIPSVTGSRLILGLLHQSWSWQQADLLHHVKATKTKQNQTFIIRNWLEELGPSLCALFDESHSSSLYQLQFNCSRKNLLKLLSSSFPFISLCFARVVPQTWLTGRSWKDWSVPLNLSHYHAPGFKAQFVLSCPIWLLLPIQTGLFSLPILPCHVSSCPVLSVPSWLRGKVISSPRQTPPPDTNR